MSSAEDFIIEPPLLNTACPWATTFEDLLRLYISPDTGAITTRTCMLNGFKHNDSIHQYRLFDPVTPGTLNEVGSDGDHGSSSLNTFGYSPHPLRQYLDFIHDISQYCIGEQIGGVDRIRADKVIIVSVTGTPEEVAQCYRQIDRHRELVILPLAVEINLSCPNIPGKPPPAYSGEELKPYLDALLLCQYDKQYEKQKHLPLGLKLPPYTYSSQFATLVDAIGSHRCHFSFLTSTNTLGNSLMIDLPTSSSATQSDTRSRAVAKESFFGLGGLAGTAIHPLSLGNVHSLRQLLDKNANLRGIKILGVGGVADHEGYQRMRAAGAYAVGVATALGRKGLSVFGDIRNSARQ
ncbi:hypothetical protein I316_06074 [Kwoniella heveanensis BCC8398]|uniref:Dihydroorotate dehydrogenase (fumarate) n=1 Tax=Kwoniella heveanensis BCC8398 TaxID=1296120 RepID=A0A1B9GM80_9TREE|nr:hypothetical protein I316_06074 [Kwoniella heveanensis BCC8398]